MQSTGFAHWLIVLSELRFQRLLLILREVVVLCR